MKERQRWQPEEDALLRAYVKQYGAKEWNLVSQRMGKPLYRDAKSCLERWKNYLKPGIKKGSLSPEEQALVISLQAKYGNKWKKIASEVPGRTAKRLGKWWEVFKEKHLKDSSNATTTISAHHDPILLSSSSDSVHSQYDHILQTFADKYVQPKLHPPTSSILMHNPPILSLASGPTEIPSSSSSLPPWLSSSVSPSPSCSSSTVSPSVSLTLSPSEPGEPVPEMGVTRMFLSVQQAAAMVQLCKEVEEGKLSWVQQRKEATWRLSRLEQQLESEKARKRREKMEDVEAKIRTLREEERAYLEKIESECREQLSSIHRDTDAKEAKLVEMWAAKHQKLLKLVDQISGGKHHHR